MSYTSDDDSDAYIPSADIDELPKSRSKRGKKSTRSNASKVGQNLLIEDDEGHVEQDFSDLTLKVDHTSRPIWITRTGIIILETASPIYQQAYDFLVAISEPQARPEHFHKYLLTRDSLYAAVALAIDTELIISVLKRLCKTELPQEVEDFIRDATSTFGKAKLVLKDNKFLIESKDPQVLRTLLKADAIKEARILGEKQAAELAAQAAQRAAANGNTSADASMNLSSIRSNTNSDGFFESSAPQELAQNIDIARVGEELGQPYDDDLEEEMAKGQTNVSFLISSERVEDVKRTALEMEPPYPLMEEYDFRNDKVNPQLTVDIRPQTKIRLYQEKSLAKMFGNGRARSGVIVLPCGAGKSLTGVTAASTIKRSTIILCINNASVKQWKEQFMIFTTLAPECVKMFTSERKEMLPHPYQACVVITTYSMICYSAKRGALAQQMIDAIRSREWGLMVLDEVHVAPADMFRKVLGLVNAHCKLGLTATLVREDNKITDLKYLVGPKLYEAN